MPGVEAPRPVIRGIDGEQHPPGMSSEQFHQRAALAATLPRPRDEGASSHIVLRVCRDREIGLRQHGIADGPAERRPPQIAATARDR